MQNQDGIAPNFVIKINGTQLSPEVASLIQDVTVEQEIGMLDMITMNVSNVYLDDANPIRQRASDSILFAEGGIVEVLMGYQDDLISMGIGTIQRWLADFPQSGMPKFTVKAVGPGWEMMRARSTKLPPFRKTTHDAIVKQLCSAYSFDTSGVMPSRIKSLVNMAIDEGTSDWDTVKKLAAANAYEFYITWDDIKKRPTVIWAPFQPNMKVTYNLYYDNGDLTTLFSFQPDFNLMVEDSVISVYAWDRVANVPIMVTLTPTKAGAKYKFAGKTGATSIVQAQLENGDAVATSYVPKGITAQAVVLSKQTDTAHAESIAQAILARGRQSFMIGKGSTVGLETMRPRQVHSLFNLGTKFSGKYYLRAVKHTMNNKSFSTNFTAHLLTDYGVV